MNNSRELRDGLPHGLLHQALVIKHLRDQEASTLNSQLQKAMSGPLSGRLRRAAADHNRINKLKAPEALGNAHFMPASEKITQ